MKTIFNTILAVLCTIITIVLTIALHKEAGTSNPIDAWLSSAAIATITMMTLAMCVGLMLIDVDVYGWIEKLFRDKGYHNYGYGNRDLIIGLFRDKPYPYTRYEYLQSQTWYSYQSYMRYQEYKEALHGYIGSQRAIIKKLYPAKGTMADMLLWQLHGMLKVFGHLEAEEDANGKEIHVFKTKGFGPKYYEPKAGDIVALRNKDYMIIMLSYDNTMEDNVLWLKELESVPQELIL